MSLTCQRFFAGQQDEPFSCSSIIAHNEVAVYCINRLSLRQTEPAGNRFGWWGRPGYPVVSMQLSSKPGGKTMTQTKF